MTASHTPPEKAVQTLAVIPSVIAAYSHLFANLRAVPAAICLPALIYLLWYGFVSFSGAGGQVPASGQAAQVPGASFLLLLLVAFLVQIFATGLLYVAWIRLTLLGPAAAWPRFFYSLERRHFRFFGTVLLVFSIVFCTVLLIGLIVGHLLSLPQSVAMAIVAVSYFLLLVKFSFVFPAIAVDESYSLRNAWKQSTGQEHRLLAGFILCILPALLLSFMVNGEALMQVFANEPVTMTPTPFWVTAFVTLFGILNGLAFISYLSIAFQTCSGWVPELPESREVGPWGS